MYKDEFCHACDYMSDDLVDYALDDGSGVVHVCLECSDNLEGRNGKE
jgi:hypothetical protein